MTLSPSRVADLTNGYEQRTDGLWLHRGKADIGTVRILNYLTPNTGQGLELGHVPGPSGAGYVQAYDRDLSASRDLFITGKNINLTPVGGALNLPAGSIGTTAIAPNAVQQLIGSYAAVPTFSTTVTGSWIGTPVLANFVSSGGLLRIEWVAAFYHSAAGGGWYLGFGYDGVASVTIGFGQSAIVNHGVTISGVMYSTPPAGSHSAQLFVDLVTPGTVVAYPSISAYLYVTEQKR